MEFPIEKIFEKKEPIYLEIKRYLGWQSRIQENNIDIQIDEAINEIKKQMNLKMVKMIFNIYINEQKNQIILDKTNLIITSKNLSEFLRGSEKIVIIAATLGVQIDKLIKRISYTDLSRSVIFDATASTLIEVFCDYIENQLRTELKHENNFLTQRFSPGYGDLSLAIQPVLLNLLNAPKKIGLYSTDSYLLTPSKSITAFMGISSKKYQEKTLYSSLLQEQTQNLLIDGCQKCLHHTRCYLKQQGENCEIRRAFIKQR